MKIIIIIARPEAHHVACSWLQGIDGAGVMCLVKSRSRTSLIALLIQIIVNVAVYGVSICLFGPLQRCYDAGCRHSVDNKVIGFCPVSR